MIIIFVSVTDIIVIQCRPKYVLSFVSIFTFVRTSSNSVTGNDDDGDDDDDVVLAWYREFETNASGVVEELYESDQAMSHELLLRKLNSWSKQTLFAVADTAEQMDFMEQDCCQTKLNKIWFGRITTYTQMWQVGVLTRT